MTVSVIFVCILMLYLHSTSKGLINKQFKIVLENPLENFPLKNMEIDFEAKNIYASGKNILYRLSEKEDKLMITRQKGPESNCLHLQPDELKVFCGDDYNTVMVVTPDSLITCGTLRGGLCLKRHKEFLNITFISPNVRLVSNDQASAVGIFLDIRDGSSSKNVVLFAKQNTSLPLGAASLDKTAIFSSLSNLSAVNNGSSQYGTIYNMTLRTSVNVVMDYRVVIENDKFVFLLVNQNSQSKLVKICKAIDSRAAKKVYEDIPISCNAGETHLTHVKHGMLITVSGKRYLVGLFSSSKPTLSAMCVFEENKIYQAFLKSRKHRYMCPKNDLPSEEMIFDEDKRLPTCITVNQSVSDFYYAFHKGDYCNDVTNQIPQFGIIVGLLPLEGNAVYSTKSHRVTVVGSSTINNLTTFFIGTDNGYVIKIYYDQVKNEAIELREIKVDKSEIRAVRNVNGKTYFMSQNKIVKLLQETQCGQYSDNCQQCMDVRDANCGWCVTNNRCSTKTECARVSPDYWLPSVKNECLSLEFQKYPSGYAYKLDANSEVSDVAHGPLVLFRGSGAAIVRVSENLSVTFMPPLKTNYNMSCRLGGSPIPTVIETDNIQCSIEPSDDRKGGTLLQILLNGNVIAERQILFYKCSGFSSCGKCIEQNKTDCYWCSEEAVCKPARGLCIKDAAIYYPYKSVTDCPQILSQNVSIPSGRSRTLVFTGNNLEVPENFIYCCNVDGSRSFCGTKIPGTNNIQCLKIKTTGEGSKIVEIKYGPRGTVPLEVFDGAVSLNSYKCESLSTYKEDCSTCHYLNQSFGYECQWCKNTGCVDVDNDQCRQAEMCGGPVVTKISPTDGPPQGGTKVSIEGLNFGIQSEVTVTVAGVPCISVKFTGRRMICITSRKLFDFTEKSKESGKVVVTVDGKNSSEDIQFTYKMPKITSISPNQGILSGGRTIHLSGTNLNIGNMNYEVELTNVYTSSSKSQVPIGCTIIKGLPVRENITCKPKRATDTGKYKVKVTFDSNTEVDSNLQFEYLPDPVITSTEPAELKSISSGGTHFNVIGEGFIAIDSLTVGVVDSEERDSRCRILTQTKLECRYPMNRESEKRRKKRASRSIIVIHLDGFSYAFTSSVLYVDDPLLAVFNGNTTYIFDPSIEESIKLVGKGLSTVTTKNEYLVYVGSAECVITNLNDSELICRPPSKKPSPRLNEEKLFIRVCVGNMRQTVGILEYSSQTQITTIVIVALSVLIIVALVVLVAVMIHRRNQVTKTWMIVNLTKEMHELKKDTTSSRTVQ